MKIYYSKDIENYEFSNKYKREFIFFKTGLVISKTNFTNELEIYNQETQSVEIGEGYVRKSFYWKLKKEYPFVYKDSLLTQNIPSKLFENKI